MPVTANELQSRMTSLRRGQGSDSRRRQRRAHLQPGAGDYVSGEDLRQCRRINEREGNGVPPLDQLTDLIGGALDHDFWDELAPPADTPVLLDVVDVEAELDAQLGQFQYVPPSPTVDVIQQTEPVETREMHVQSSIQQVTVSTQANIIGGQNAAVNTDGLASGDYLPEGCSLANLVATAISMPESGSRQIAARLLMDFGPTSRGHRQQLEVVLQVVLVGQRAVARHLVRVLNNGNGTRLAAEESIHAALRQLEEQASRYVDGDVV